MGHFAATGTGGGGGESHGWTVRGSDLTVIQAGHLDESSSTSSRPGTVPGGAFFVSFFGFGSGLAVGEEKLRASLSRPSLRRAILAVREENMVVVGVLDPGRAVRMVVLVALRVLLLVRWRDGMNQRGVALDMEM